MPNYEVTGDAAEPIEFAGERPRGSALAIKLSIGKDWTLPAIRIAPLTRQAPDIVILVADVGRAALAERVESLVAEGKTVLAVDPLFIGEANVKAQDPEYTYPLMSSAAGERALGIQAAQAVAVARWARKQNANRPVMLISHGPGASLAAPWRRLLRRRPLAAWSLTARWPVSSN